MNYKPGDKVKVTVNGATWEDEIRHKANSINEYFLQSGITVPASALNPIIAIIKNIEPEQGDIVEVWDDGEDKSIQEFWYKSEENVPPYFCKVSTSWKSWNHCHILARRIKQFDKMTHKERRRLYDISDNILNADDYQKTKDAYNDLISFILGGAPYARVDE
jgi:hypothetical protein